MRLARCSLLCLFLCLLVPASAGAVAFSGPTNFGAGTAPNAIAVADFNADGKADLAVTNAGGDNEVSILLGAGNGFFGTPTPFPVHESPASIAVGNFNGDSDPDLAVANLESEDVSILLGAAGGTFTGPTNIAVGLNATSVAVGFFDGDANADLAVTTVEEAGLPEPDSVAILLGNGSGGFVDEHEYDYFPDDVAWDVAVGDFDQSGDADLAVTLKTPNDVSIRTGNGDGTFSGSTSYDTGSDPGDLVVGNFNADSDPDLVVANAGGENVSILLGSTGATFTGPTNFAAGEEPRGIASADFNEDGKPDLAVTDAESDKVSILLGTGSGNFTAPTTFNAASAPFAVATGQFNGGPKIDLAVANVDSNNVSVLLGQSQPTLGVVGTDAKIGGLVHATATLAGGSEPTGSLVFEAFSPANPACEGGSPVFTETVGVNGNKAYESTSFAPALIGTYHWVVTYSGDVNNTGEKSDCTATSVVSKATPSLSSTATNGTAGGTPIKDTATLSGGVNPGGNLVFKAFGPNDANCQGAVAYEKIQAVAGNAQYGSGDFAAAKAGTYFWTIEYTGDAKNEATTSACEAPNETSTVAKASPTLSTTATSASIGNSIKDTATIASGAAPGGKVKFKVFGPNDTNCTGGAVFSAEVNVSGNAAYESGPFTPSSVGAYRWTAEYTGDANNNTATSGCNAANETSNVTGVTPTLSSTAASGTAGGTISDSATLSGGASPGGTLTFKAFGPNDPTCTGTPAFAPNPVTVSGNNTYSSGSFANPLAGEYRWTVVYSGDANNGAVTSPCNAANETSTVAKATPTLNSNAANGTAGGTISDSATLAAGAGPGGTLTFKAFGPNNATCSGAAAYVSPSPITVSGNATYPSGSFANPLAGEYRWTVSYSGDANNNAVTSACNAPNETSTVAKASPTIATAATSGAVGAAIKDTATIAAGATPTGTITFKAFGPNDSNCGAAVAFEKQVSVNGNGDYGSTDFKTTATGTYHWTAEYTGDANNNAATSPCEAPNETSNVVPASPTLSSVAASSIYPNPISDTVTIAGGFTPTGTLTFKAFGPNDATCAGVAAFTSAPIAVAGNGSYGSGSFTNPEIGSYRWTVTYSGDADDNPATSACNAANETSTVAKVPPQIAVNTANTGIGGPIASFATFGGGLQHTGQVVFRVYGPNDPTCQGAAASFAPVPVTAGNSTYASGPFTPATAGAYHWTASYSGDAINAAETTACGAAIATVAPAAPALAAHISAASITAGDSVRDTATISAGFKPTGTLTFKLFGPGDTNCSGSPALSSTVAVSGNGSYPSADLVPRAAGDYRFTVSYSGDASNTPIAAACGAGGEFVQVQKRTPTLKAKASVRGKKIIAQATLGGADSPQGKVTFRIYGPGDNRCTRKPVFSSQRAVHGTGNYNAAGYKFESSGLYRFTVAYSGDERNKSLKKGCATRGQSVRVP